MMMKSLILTAVATLGLTAATMAQTWNLLIPPVGYDTEQLNFSNTAFNQNNSFFYSVYKVGASLKIQSFNLNSNSVSEILTSNPPPVDLYSFTYDYTNDRLVANRSGRENVYAVSSDGGAWAQIGNGSFDAESYGASFFWNSSNSSVGFFGGYGFGFTKNWIWENSNSWANPYLNNTICNISNPAKRHLHKYALGDPSSTRIYLFSGMGNCSGQQTVPSCSLGSPWATDIGVYCWLRDLWEIDLNTHQFTNILPVNSGSISSEGQIVYDYTNNTFYILGGYVPSPTYDPNFNNITDFETEVLRFRVGIDSGFTPLAVGGTPPPTEIINNLGPNAAFYDAINNQIVWARKDGVWAFSACEQPTPATACYETASFNTTTCQWEVTGSQPTISQPTNQTINNYNNAQFTVDSSDPSATYQWQTDLGVGFQNINDVGQYTGATSSTLTVSNVSLTNNNQPFRCIVTSGACSDTSDVAMLTVVDGGLCSGEVVYGCEYLTACNYNAEATVGDGSCIFPEPNYDCEGNCLLDANMNGICDQFETVGPTYCGEGTIWDAALNLCIGFNDCLADFDNSGAVDVADILVFLSLFGNVCD